MERLDRLINILKLTQHSQPELVKEATHRILTRSLRYDPKINYFLKHVLEILIKYCDSDDGAQRSLFNDYLNSVILAFQDHCYQTIFQVLAEIVTNNGSTRTVTAALLRIPLLINNVKPIELGYDQVSLLKALIEIARRNDDDSVQKALNATLDEVVPFLNFRDIKKESRFLSGTLVDVILRNLSSPTRRSAVHSLASFTSNSNFKSLVLSKLKVIFDTFIDFRELEPERAEEFIGICLAIKELPSFTVQYNTEILDSLLKQILLDTSDNISVVALEAARETIQRAPNQSNILIPENLIDALIEKYLVKQDVKIIIITNTLALISRIIQLQPELLKQNSRLDKLISLRSHQDLAVRGQVYYLIGSYIDSCWALPRSIERSISCEKVAKLWNVLKSALYDDQSHPDTLKSVIVGINLCIKTLMTSDQCSQIISYEDFDKIILLYSASSYKPFKVEVLKLLVKIDYLILDYMERQHQNGFRTPSTLQDRIIMDVVVRSLTNNSDLIRTAASTTLVAIVPHLYSSSTDQKSCDPIERLAKHLADEHLSIVEQEHISMANIRQNEEMVVRSENKTLSSSILSENYNRESNKSVVSTNLSRLVTILRTTLENSLEYGKSSVLSIVKTILLLSKAYPIHQFPTSWDCRPSEHCDCFIMFDFLLEYIKNMTPPDVVIEDLEAYRTFIDLTTTLLYALCHETVFNEYERQRMKPDSKRVINLGEVKWSELMIKYDPIAQKLQIFFNHLVKLLRLISYVVEEKSNPFSMASTKIQYQRDMDTDTDNSTLISNRTFFGKIHKKLESSYKSSKKNLRRKDEKFPQIVQTCLNSISTLLEFMGSGQSREFVKDIILHLRVISTIDNMSTLICARQLIKSLFCINIIAIYQINPLDWFEEEASSDEAQDEESASQDTQDLALQGVYHHLVTDSYKTFADYLSKNCSQITPGSDRALASRDFESRRAMRLRYRIEETVKSLFEFEPQQIVLPQLREMSNYLKSTIVDFTPLVADCMRHFERGGFCQYQSEVLHFMSYLILLRVNYQKLPMANSFESSLTKLIDDSGDGLFLAREKGIDLFLQNCFTFYILQTYERGPKKPVLTIASVIQMYDDIRARVEASSARDPVVSTYIVPLLKSLVEDLFIYRTEQIENAFTQKKEVSSQPVLNDCLEAERETVIQKLFYIIENPGAYDLLSIIILESRLNRDGHMFEKLSQRLFDLLPDLLIRFKLSVLNQERLELAKRIFENISTEIFKPVNFILKTFLDNPCPNKTADSQLFQHWMSLIIIDIHILTTQVKEDKFLARISETISEESFVQYLFQISQLCAAELFLSGCHSKDNSFIVQQLSYYIQYLTYMFQSGLFFQLSKHSPDYITNSKQSSSTIPKDFWELCQWARDPSNEFSLDACEPLFYYIRYLYPHLNIMWCNLMTLLNNVDCNSDFWFSLLIYDCHQCLNSNSARNENCRVIVGTKFKPNKNVNRPSSLELLDINFNDQLRRSFIKRIATMDARQKPLDQSMEDTCIEDVTKDLCLAPNVELSRRGALCLVLDFVSISMIDVEHISWLIIHHIRDIIKWSHETPIAEFISSVHGISASSGIFIQAIDTNINDLTSFSFVTRLLWTLEKVHYTQYGSLVILLVEKLLSSDELMPYRILTKRVEDFACEAVQKLLNDTNKSLITTSDEIINQLTTSDLDRIISMIDHNLYSRLTDLLTELRETTKSAKRPQRL